MMKKTILCTMAVIATVICTSWQPLRAQNEPAPGEGARLLAHRGGRAEIDENTLEAFAHAFDSGCTAFETDVRMSKDGALMILHDNDFNRVCGDPRAPEEMTAEEIRALRTKDGHRIPFLDEVLDFLSRHDWAYVEFELKCSDVNRYPQARLEEYLDKVAAAVYAAKPEHSVYLMTSFDTRAMRYLTVKHPEADPMLITGKPCNGETIGLCQALGVRRLACTIGGSSRETLAAAHKAGLRVNLWPTTRVEDVHLAWLLGADYICTDIPAEAVRYIAARSLPIRTAPGK